MKTKKIQLSVPEPCHEDWNKMTPKDQGAFCGACSKVVVDFTKMTNREVIQYFEEKKGQKTCGRFKTQQLDVPISALIPSNSFYSRYKNLMLSFFLGLSLPSFLKADNYRIKMNPFSDQAELPSQEVSGQVLNEQDEVLSNVEIILFYEGKQQELRYTTDTQGKFNIRFSSDFKLEEVKLRFSHEGYLSEMVELESLDNLSVYLAKKQTFNGVLGKVAPPLEYLEESKIEVQEEVKGDTLPTLVVPEVVVQCPPMDRHIMGGAIPIAYVTQGQTMVTELKELPQSKPMYFPESVVGQVVDEKGEALPFASILIENHPEIGVLSDIEGYFMLILTEELRSQKDLVLKTHSIGFETLEVTINPNSEDIRLVLKEDHKINVMVGFVVLNPEYIDRSPSSFDNNYQDIQPKWQRLGYPSRAAFKEARKAEE